MPENGWPLPINNVVWCCQMWFLLLLLLRIAQKKFMKYFLLIRGASHSKSFNRCQIRLYFRNKRFCNFKITKMLYKFAFLFTIFCIKTINLKWLGTWLVICYQDALCRYVACFRYKRGAMVVGETIFISEQFEGVITYVHQWAKNCKMIWNI